MTHSETKPHTNRILRFAKRTLATLLLLLLVMLVLIHIPAIQQIVARKTATFLSAKTKSSVSIDQLRFSIFGEISLDGVKAVDPEGNLILSAAYIEVEVNPITLLRGDFHIQKVSLHDADGRLSISEAGLNINYFIEAFRSEDTIARDKDSKPFAMLIDHIDFRDVRFRFQSHPDILDLNIQLVDMETDDFSLKTSPLAISASALRSDSFDLNIISDMAASGNDAGSSSYSDTSSELTRFLELDFGIDFPIEVKEVDIRHASFSYHVSDVVHSPNFDPEHLDFNEILISIVDLSIHEDALAGKIDTVSTVLPIIGHTGISGHIDANNTDLTISDLLIRSANSQADIDISAHYTLWPEFLNQIEQVESELTLAGNMDPRDLSYFLSDSFIPYFEHWSHADVSLQAKINNKTVRIESSEVRVGDSRVTLDGSFNQLNEGVRAVGWDAVNIYLSVGSEFHRTLGMIAYSAYLPDTINLQISSSGTSDTFDLTAEATTNWGVFRATGGAGIIDAGLFIDMDVHGEEVDLASISSMDWVDKTNFSISVAGNIHEDLSLMLDGKIQDISILDEVVYDVQVQSKIENDSVVVSISIIDSLYKLGLTAGIQVSDHIGIQAGLMLEDFDLDIILGRDTSALVTGTFNTEAIFSDSTISGFVRGHGAAVGTAEGRYSVDSLDLNLTISPSASTVTLVSDDVIGDFTGNFDLRDLGVLLDSILTENFRVKSNPIAENAGKKFDFQLDIKNDDLLRLAGVQFEQFDGATLTGQLDQIEQTLSVVAHTGRFVGLGLRSDTISFNFFTSVDELKTQVDAVNIEYDSMRFGDLRFRLFSDVDTSGSALFLYRDSVVLIDLITRLSVSDLGLDIYPDHLIIVDQVYQTSWDSPIFVSRDSFDFDHLKISDANKELSIDGNVNHYDIALRDIQLAKLNYLVSPDSAFIKSGILNGEIAYDKFQKLLNANIQVDSLRIANSALIHIEAEAHTEGSNIPFNATLSSSANNIQFGGNYIFDTKEIDATLNLDLADAQHLEFLTRNFLDKFRGSLSGDLRVHGPISQPHYNGILNIKELQVIASGTGSTVNIYDQELVLNDSGLKFNDFTIFDQKNNQLAVSGAIKTEDFRSLDYDLNIHTDKYILFEKPYTDGGQALQGVLAVASDIQLTGDQNDTHLEVAVTVLDTSNLTYIMPQKEIEFITDEGIVQFVDPNDPLDSANYNLAPSFFDSLLATLPSLALNSVITLEKNASLKVTVDPRSGDYIEASGAAVLELKMDRTGNLRLNGKYTITDGIYQLSFYGIAKKRFKIAPKSKIQWNGDPTNGDLDILAIHYVKTSSTGLIGHEVGENEQSLYRKALEYQVGIVIKGTIKKPEISFTLDLPEDDKIDYPALANKLSRLAQPEFESELNKQVFGLLVIGGFVPETTGSDMGELAVATTLSNSVSSILSAQLNRFINENVEGLEVDIGMHSYADYTTGGSQTRTAMDFRVTKRMLNDRLSFELGAEVDLNSDQSGANTGQNSFRGDIAVIYDLTESGNKKLKAFNNETYDIIYHEIRNTGIAFILIKEFDRKNKNKRKRE